MFFGFLRRESRMGEGESFVFWVSKKREAESRTGFSFSLRRELGFVLFGVEFFFKYICCFGKICL